MIEPKNIAAELARPTPDCGSPQFQQWTAWISRAYLLITNRLGADAVAALDPDVVDAAALIAVAEHVRAWRDSTASRYTVAVDDATVSRTYEASVGALSIPDAAWAMLDSTFGNSEAFTIRPVATPTTTGPSDPWYRTWI